MTTARTTRSRTAAAAAALVSVFCLLVSGMGVPAAASPANPSVAPASDPSAGSGAATVTRTTFRAARSKPVKCDQRTSSTRHTDRTAVVAPVTGLVRVELAPAKRRWRSGDWDVAVFQRADKSLVASSAGPRSYEVADGFVHEGDRLWVRACRYRGKAPRVRASVSFFATPAAPTGETASLVSVATPERSDKTKLVGLGLDLTESGGPDHLDVVLHGKADADTLSASGLRWTVKVADLRAEAEQARRADRRYARAVASSDLPSGRTGYRRLADYEYELKELARRHPRLVRLDVLPERSVEGRDLVAVEITQHVSNRSDGKPVFLNFGVHHAREWPAGEQVMEFAYDLVQGYGHDARTTRLLRAARAIILPIANPDGFSVSRQAAPLGDFSAFDYENKRKNCSAADAPTAALRSGPCPVTPAGRYRGTDLNRNFGAFWGGVGAGTAWDDDTYRGPAPFSEPESQALREFTSTRQITNEISNHTFSNLVLRPPGVAGARLPVDTPLLKQLGDAMASHNGYDSLLSYQLYDTTGTTDDWAYWITGALSYTIETGLGGFHPPFADGVVAEYLGKEPAAGAGLGGNREAYFTMLESTARASDHATLTGRAPEGWRLRLHKTFQTPTSPVVDGDGSTGPALLVGDTLTSSLRAPGGRFSWAVNPSTRPYVAGRFGRVATAPPQAGVTLANPAGRPAENQDDPFTGPHEEASFTVDGLPTADNGTASVQIRWTDPRDDWDLYVTDADGNVVAQSATGGDNVEKATLLDPKPGTYTAVVVNYEQVDESFDDWSGAVSFASPDPPEEGVREAWTLTCERPGGSIAAVQQVVVDRGQSVDVGRACRQQKTARVAGR